MVWHGTHVPKQPMLSDKGGEATWQRVLCSCEGKVGVQDDDTEDEAEAISLTHPPFQVQIRRQNAGTLGSCSPALRLTTSG